MAEQELAAAQLATLDDLTLLSNRRGFEALAQHALNVCKRLEKPASLLFFDLNDFKQINDSHGHAEGDRAAFPAPAGRAQCRREARLSDPFQRRADSVRARAACVDCRIAGRCGYSDV